MTKKKKEELIEEVIEEPATVLELIEEVLALYPPGDPKRREAIIEAEGKARPKEA